MFTYLYMASSKAKTAATEEGKKLSARINKNVTVEINWKFVDLPAYKGLSQDDQKNHIGNCVVPNLVAIVTGAPDSIANVMSSNGGLAAAVDKVVLNYTADAMTDPVKCVLNGKTLDIFIPVTSVTQMMAATWKFGDKLNALASGAPTVAPVATPTPMPKPGGAVAAPTAARPVVAAAAAPPAAAAASSPRLIPAVKENKITPSSGKATFLYMTLNKAQTAFKTGVEPQLATAFGKPITAEIDWRFVDLVEFYGYITQDQQKLILTDKVVPCLKSCVTDAQDSVVSLAAGPHKATFATKVSKIVFKYNTVSGVSAALNGSALEITLDINYVEDPKSPSWALATQITNALTGVVSAAPAAAAASPAVARPVEPPVVKQIGTPAATVTAPVAAVASSAAPAGVRQPRAKIGGPAGGKGKFTFLYTSFENAKKKIAEIATAFTAMCKASFGTALLFEVDWAGFIEDDAFVALSQADQKAILTTSVVENVRAVLTSDAVIPALFKAAKTDEPSFQEYLNKVKKVRWVYDTKDYVVSDSGVRFAELAIGEDDTNLEIRVNLGAIDDVLDPDNFAPVDKMFAAIEFLSNRERIMEERIMKAEEEKMRQAEQARIMAEEAQRRSDAERRVKMEAEEKRVREQAAANAGARQAVIAPLRPALEAFSRRICASMGLSSFILDIDDFFVDDKRLRFKEINYKETLLKNMTGEKSVFHFLTLAIEQVAKIPLAKAAFVQKVSKVVLRCIPQCPSPYPDVNLHDDTKVLFMDCTFSHLYDPAKWTAATLAFRESEIVEIYKAEIMHDLGCEVEGAQWEASQRAQDVINTRFIPAITGTTANKITMQILWETMAPTVNTARNEGWLPIRLALAHHVVPESILEKIVVGAEGLNLVVKKILLRDIKTIVFRFGTTSSVDLDPTAGTMTINLIFYKLALEIPTMRQWFINQVHAAAIAKCVGITVKSVGAEMAIENAKPALQAANDILTREGFPAITVSWPEFVDSNEFQTLYADLSSKTPYGVISGLFAGTLTTLANGFMMVATTALGRKHAPKVKVIRVTVDPKTPEFERLRPVLSWSEAKGEFVAKFGMSRLSVPESYQWRPQLEKIFGILLDTIRMELENRKDRVIEKMIADFGKKIPITLDESFTTTPQFLALDPEDMDQIMRPFLTTMPASLFHSAEGLAKVVELPPGKQTAHERITSIRVCLDSKNPQSNSYSLSLTNGELVASCGFRFAHDGATTVEPVGYKIIDEVLKIRGVLEQHMIASYVANIQQLQKDLEKASGVAGLPVTMDWKFVLDNPSFAKDHDFVNKMRHIMVIMDTLVRMKNPKNRWNNGLATLLPSFADDFRAKVKSVVFRIDCSCGAKGSKHGRFPDRETMADISSAGVLIVTSNYRSGGLYGCGAHVEHLVDPRGAKDAEADWIEKVASMLYVQEEQRRERVIADTHAENASRQNEYTRDQARFNKDVVEYQKNLTKKCTGCKNGYWNQGRNKHMSCGGTGLEYGKRKPKEPKPPRAPTMLSVPTFVAISSIDFQARASRETLLEFF